MQPDAVSDIANATIIQIREAIFELFMHFILSHITCWIQRVTTR